MYGGYSSHVSHPVTMAILVKPTLDIVSVTHSTQKWEIFVTVYPICLETFHQKLEKANIFNKLHDKWYDFCLVPLHNSLLMNGICFTCISLNHWFHVKFWNPFSNKQGSIIWRFSPAQILMLVSTHGVQFSGNLPTFSSWSHVEKNPRLPDCLPEDTFINPIHSHIRVHCLYREVQGTPNLSQVQVKLMRIFLLSMVDYSQSLFILAIIGKKFQWNFLCLPVRLWGRIKISVVHLEHLPPSVSWQLINCKTLFSFSIFLLNMTIVSHSRLQDREFRMKTGLEKKNDGFSCTLLDYITFYFSCVCSTWIR